jgi:hypothetical protein
MTRECADAARVPYRLRERPPPAVDARTLIAWERNPQRRRLRKPCAP